MIRSLLLASALFLPRLTPAQGPVFADDFNVGPVDPARWRVVLPFSNPPATTVRTTNGTLELFRRGIVEATPALPSAIDIEGRFRFVGDADTLSVVFRSDLTVTNQAERRGVQAALQQGTGRVFLIPEPFATAPLSGSFTIGRDTNVAFRVTDNGEMVRLFVQDFFQPVLTATITNRRGNRLVVYNLNGTTSRAQVDGIAVFPLQTSIFIDDTLVRTGAVRRSTPARVRLQSIYTNSTVFYTLDGSLPSFVSAEYAGPFTLSNSATIRAIAYTGDFQGSSLSTAVEFQFLPLVRLTNETLGGGAVAFDPPGPYFSNQIVRLTAMPAPGWQFLRWEGAATGTATSNQVTMTNHLALRGVFGTAPAITVIGSGQVQSVPAGPTFEFGAVTRLLALPSAGNYFVRWANALTGSVSPATLIVTNAAPAISALFAALGPAQTSLTVLLEGAGTVAVVPPVNVFTNGQLVVLTAQPDLQQVFLGWSGAFSGQTNPLRHLMAGSQTVAARFAPGVRFDPAQLRFDSNGFRLFLKGGPDAVLELQQSTNLNHWNPVTTWTNSAGSLLYPHREAANLPRLFYRVVGP